MDDSPPPRKGKSARPKGNEAHPVGKERIQALKNELELWEVERARTLKKLGQKQDTLATA